MLVIEISSEYESSKTVYHLHIDKSISIEDFDRSNGLSFKYDNKNWMVYSKWILSIDKVNNIIVVSDFERINKNKRRVFIIEDLLK
jgi:hypothetical protein